MNCKLVLKGDILEIFFDGLGRRLHAEQFEKLLGFAEITFAFPLREGWGLQDAFTWHIVHTESDSSVVISVSE